MLLIFCSVNSAGIWGIEPYVVKVEADLSQGMPYFNMVGLLSSEVKEARERVRTAIKNSGESIPMYRVTVNLSPADRRKGGTGFDLAIAVAMLCVMGRIDERKIKDALIVGELGLNGEIKKINGVLPIVSMAKKKGFKYCILPRDNYREAMLVSGIKIVCFESLREMIDFFDSGKLLVDYSMELENESDINVTESYENKDFSDISGQEIVKRAIVVAVAGWHNLLMIGAPGVGKSMLASRIPYVMPELNEEEQMEVANIKSICGMFRGEEDMKIRPFMAPYHTITAAALVGGGTNPKPGEITMAHKGILFLDELPEFSPQVIDLLRQPLEERCIRIHRSSGYYVFPAECMVVAAMNPCRCGYYPDRTKCNCSEIDVNKYLGRVSGPVLDRMDMSIEVPRVDVQDIDRKETKYTNYNMKKMINNAIEFRNERCRNSVAGSKTVGELKDYVPNGRLVNESIIAVANMDKDAGDFLKEAYVSLELSMRGYYKVLKVARTIADLDMSDRVEINHISEALGYRITVK